MVVFVVPPHTGRWTHIELGPAQGTIEPKETDGERWTTLLSCLDEPLRVTEIGV